MLAASASNIAVDNLVERLITANPKLMVVRVGHPARLLPQVRYDKSHSMRRIMAILLEHASYKARVCQTKKDRYAVPTLTVSIYMQLMKVVSPVATESKL